MNLEGVLKIIGLKCGNRDLEEMIEFAIPHVQLFQSQAQSDPFLPWFLKEEGEFEVDAEGGFVLPEGFLKVDHTGGVWYKKDDSLTELCVGDTKQAISKYGARAGVPEFLVVRKDRGVVFPFTDEGTLHFDYFKKAPELSQLSDVNVWLENAPWYIAAGAGLAVAQDLEHAPAVKFFSQQLELYREMLFRQDVERNAAGQRFYF